jgi:hypothetical protein
MGLRNLVISWLYAATDVITLFHQGEGIMKSPVAVAVACLALVGCTTSANHSTDLSAIAEFATADDFAQAGASGGAAWTPVLAGALVEPNYSASRSYFSPTPAGKVRTVVLGQQQDVEWNTLTAKQTLGLLDQSDEEVTLHQVQEDGKLRLLTSEVTAGRGRYVVTYYYYRFRSIACRLGAPQEGGIGVGVGLRVTASIVTNKANINVSDLMPLAAAAGRNEVSGRLRVQSVGFASGTSNIASYLNANGGLSPESIRKAVESFGVVKALIETETLALSPNWLFIEAAKPTECLATLIPRVQT